MENSEKNLKNVRKLGYKGKLRLTVILSVLVVNTFISIGRYFVAKKSFFDSTRTQLSEIVSLNKRTFLSDVSTEQKLALQTAKMPSIINYCKDPKDKILAKNAWDEMSAFAKALDIGLTFYVSDVDKHFYYCPTGENFIVDSKNPDYYWYNMTLGMPKGQDYNFNINYAAEIGQTQLWMNAVIRDEQGKSIGMAGSGINISTITDKIFEGINDNTTFYMFNNNFEIVGSKDLKKVEDKVLINTLYSKDINAEIESYVKSNPTNIKPFKKGETQYVLCPIPEVGWNIIASQTFNSRMMFQGSGATTYYLIFCILILIGIGLGRICHILHDIFEKEKELGLKMDEETQNLVVASKETAATSQDQSAAVKEIVATMEDSNSLSESIAQKIKDVSQVAQKTTCDVSDGASALSTNLEKLHEIFNANQQTINGIKLLGDKIENIWDIVTLINSVADQAKIIAFNAELEAASAGEAGKNFHIVATEIRRLADGIIDGTKEIKEKINEIQQSSDSLILASESGTERINEGCKTAKELEEKFTSIRSAAEITADSAGEITTIIQQQAVGSGQILITLKQIAAGVENFTAATENVSTSAQNLKTIADELNKQVINTTKRNRNTPEEK